MSVTITLYDFTYVINVGFIFIELVVNVIKSIAPPVEFFTSNILGVSPWSASVIVGNITEVFKGTVYCVRGVEKTGKEFCLIFKVKSAE